MGQRTALLIEIVNQQGEALPDVVVQFAGNPMSFFFLRIDELACQAAKTIVFFAERLLRSMKLFLNELSLFYDDGHRKQRN